MNQPTDPANSDTNTNLAPTGPSKKKPELQDAPPAEPGHEEMHASDSGKPWIVGMVAGAMLIIGLVIGSLIWSAPDMRQYVQPFLESVSHEQYAKAYSEVGQEWRGMMPEKNFVKMHKILHDKLGEFISLKQTDLQENDHPVLGRVNIVHFDARFANGKVDLTAILRKTADGWSLLNMEYVTPLLTPSPTSRPAAKPARRSKPRRAPKAAVPPAKPDKPADVQPPAGQ